VPTAEGSVVSAELIRDLEVEEVERLLAELGGAGLGDGRAKEAAELFETVALSEEFVDFLTLPAYEMLEP
jgi:malate synthase